MSREGSQPGVELDPTLGCLLTKLMSSSDTGIREYKMLGPREFNRLWNQQGNRSEMHSEYYSDSE